MEKRPAYRSGYLYYPTALVNADRALDEARMAGKDRECLAEFNAAKDMVDKAYEVYMACRTQEAIDMAQEAISKIKALCPARPRAEMKPEPKPEPKPVPRPEPKVVEKVILLEDVHFDLDKSTLTKEAQTILKRNIQVLKENPNVKIIIQGHTSAIATEEYNQKLSERRANSVNEFLIKEGGIAPDRLSTVGYGETRLEMPEPNPEIKESAAAKVNRRVIFKVIVE
jgi:outer membrane protein OmpA-like peptidoglycan-associated protein